MDPLFCCFSILPFKPKHIDNDPKFNSFLIWEKSPTALSTLAADPTTSTASDLSSPSSFVIQLVKQVNYGPVESIRYFVTSQSGFQETTAQWLIDADFQKLNAFKNFRCGRHNKFFELNVYMKDPVNKHHWRVIVTRPWGAIDF